MLAALAISDVDTPVAAAIDPCGLPRAIVSSAIGAAVDAVRPWESGIARGCRYSSPHAGPWAAVSAALETSLPAAKANFGRMLSMSAGNPRGRPVRLTGIGDAAASIDGVLYVRRGRALYAFSAARIERGTEVLRIARRLARVALPRLTPYRQGRCAIAKIIAELTTASGRRSCFWMFGAS